MLLEFFYKNNIITIGHPYIERDIFVFLPKKTTFFKKYVFSLFEQHSIFWKNKNLWTRQKFWNYFCWFFFKKYGINSDVIIDKKTPIIVFWDMIGLYKAWRHCKGYPVNGQRTWSNGKSCTKNNLLLRIYRLKQFQNTFGIKKKTNYIVLIQAEMNNKLWIKTWPFEWLQGRFHAIRSKSRKGSTIPIDVINLAKGITTGYKRFGKAERWNKSKKALKTVTIGLPLYFTRFLYGNLRKKYFKYQLSLLQPDKKKK